MRLTRAEVTHKRQHAVERQRDFPHIHKLSPTHYYVTLNKLFKHIQNSVMSDSLQPHGLYSPWNSPGQNAGMNSLSLLQGIFPTQVFALQADSLPAEPTGKPKKTGVGSLSLLQQIFPTQELNRGLLHCRWILYQLSYEGSPTCLISK